MTDALELLIDSKVKWVSEPIKTFASILPRHIGRVASVTVYRDSDPSVYDSFDVIGIFEGITEDSIVIAGVEYPWSKAINLKIYRRELA